MKKVQTLENHFFACECHSSAHTLRFTFDPEISPNNRPELWTEVFLGSWQPWYWRIWAAIKYVLKMRPSNYGHWDCWMVPPEEAQRLLEMTSRYVAAYENYEKLLENKEI